MLLYFLMKVFWSIKNKWFCRWTCPLTHKTFPDQYSEGCVCGCFWHLIYQFSTGLSDVSLFCFIYSFYFTSIVYHDFFSSFCQSQIQSNIVVTSSIVTNQFKCSKTKVIHLYYSLQTLSSNRCTEIYFKSNHLLFLGKQSN